VHAGALAEATALDCCPLALGDDGCSSAIDNEVDGVARNDEIQLDIKAPTAASEGRVIGSFEIDYHWG